MVGLALLVLIIGLFALVIGFSTSVALAAALAKFVLWISLISFVLILQGVPSKSSH